MGKEKSIAFNADSFKKMYSEYGIVMVLVLLIIIATIMNPIFIGIILLMYCGRYPLMGFCPSE